MSHIEFQIQLDEKILMQIRKHWFVLLLQSFGLIILAITPLMVGVFALATLHSVSSSAAAIFTFFASLWLLISWIGFAIIWTNYYLDMWIVTDRRIVYVEQISFFVREVTTLSLERVQDATVRYGGIIETLLDFGTLRVQSAGAIENEVVMHGVPHPNDVKRFVLAQVDRFSPRGRVAESNPSSHEQPGGI